MTLNSNTENQWKLLDIAQKVLPFGNPVQKCKRVTTGNVQFVKTEKGYGYRGIVSCGSNWSCPICSPQKASRKAWAIGEMDKKLDYKRVLVTYTVQHNIGDSLQSLINVLYDSLRSARNGDNLANFKKHAEGYVRSTETLHNRQTGWHIHIHEMVYMKSGSSINDIHKTVVRSYKKAVEKRGKFVNQHTVDAQNWNGGTEYITKNADIREVTGFQTKTSRVSLLPFQVLRRAETDPYYSSKFREYYDATKGRKITMVSRSLMNEYKRELNRYDKENKSHVEEVLSEIEPSTWADICRKRIRYQIFLTLSGTPVRDVDIPATNEPAFIS